MYRHPSAMEPLLPAADSELADLALDLVAESARTAGSLHPVTERSLHTRFRSINSYYSNLIEGHNTHPVDIERALREDYSADPAKRALQLESRAHIELQEAIEKRLAHEPELQICSAEFLCWLHDRFYQRLPRVLRTLADPETGARDEVLPGALRRRDVRVGRHIPPQYAVLDHFLRRFAQVYAPERHRGHGKLIAAVASHHRLTWIHPFLDGNGRVTRLFTDTYFQAVGLKGYGLWSVSRGLARRRTDYLSQLAAADAQRRNDYDGRGNLSLEGLTGCCRFLLETCIDQARFMGELLAADTLHSRAARRRDSARQTHETCGQVRFGVCLPERFACPRRGGCCDGILGARGTGYRRWPDKRRAPAIGFPKRSCTPRYAAACSGLSVPRSFSGGVDGLNLPKEGVATC